MLGPTGLACLGLLLAGFSPSATPRPLAQARMHADIRDTETRMGRWELAQAEALLAYINKVGQEGLSPVDYDPAGLAEAIQAGNQDRLDDAATKRFYWIAADLALGRVPDSGRADWHIADDGWSEAEQRRLLESALSNDNIEDALDSLLPTHPQYHALRTSLARTVPADATRIRKIRLNMDRWRWLPRELGAKYVIVNVPSFYATLVDHGATRWKRRAMVGAIHTPTPQISVSATGAMLNPWWEVPKSLEASVRGRPGFVPARGKGGKIQRWRQPPGPSNALGQMKFVMANDHAIFLHDTNARSRFASAGRALSHGCIRTQDIQSLAAELGSDDGGEWTRERIDEALAAKQTVEARFVKPVRVYIVYFSLAARHDGTLIDYDDLYGRDAPAASGLDALPARSLASRNGRSQA